MATGMKKILMFLSSDFIQQGGGKVDKDVVKKLEESILGLIELKLTIYSYFKKYKSRGDFYTRQFATEIQNHILTNKKEAYQFFYFIARFFAIASGAPNWFDLPAKSYANDGENPAFQYTTLNKTVNNQIFMEKLIDNCRDKVKLNELGMSEDQS